MGFYERLLSSVDCSSRINRKHLCHECNFNVDLTNIFDIIKIVFHFFLKTAETLDFPQLATVGNVLVGILVTVFIVCELGQRVTDIFESFSMELEQCVWYLPPIKMQRMYLIFLAHTQQTPNIQGYGNITCTRDTFERVIVLPFTITIFLILFSSVSLFTKTIHGGFSYFMTIRQIYG